MKTKTKHMFGYAGTAVLALSIGAAAGGADSSNAAAPAVATTVHSTETVTAPAPDAQPAEAKTTTVKAPAVTNTITVTKKAGPAKPKATIPGDGTYEVGKDIQPGTYVSGVPDSGNCYWARMKGTSGSMDDIIANNNSAGQSVVTIAASDKVFESSGCNDWARR